MTAKEYLRQYRKLTESLRQLESDLRKMEEERDSIQIRADGMPGSSNVSKRVESLAIRITDLQRRTMARREKLLAKREEIRAVIMLVPDPKLSRLLDLRYVEGMKWEAIAENMGVEVRHIYRLHGRALQEADKILPNYERCH